MIYVVKVTEAAGQHRITLPKTFCKQHEISEADYLVIDDNDPERMTIGRFMHDSKQKTQGA